MKLETTAGSLHSALVASMPFIDRRSSIPILGAVLIADDKVTATNLDMVATIPFACTSAKGRIAVEHSRLMKILSFLPRDEAINLQGGAEGVTLSFGTGRYDLPKFDPADYPENPSGETGDLIDADGLVRALRFVSSFISTEETRYYLNGVCFDGSFVVATNGHALGRMKTSFSVDDRPIVPREAVHQVMRRHIKQMSFGDKVARFVGHGITILTKLIDGTFPDYQRVIPNKEISDAASTFTVKTADFIGALKRASCLHQYTSLGVSPFGDLALYGKGAEWTSAAHEFLVAESVDRVDAPLVTAVGAGKLLRILAEYRDREFITLRISDPSAPIEIVSNDDRYSLLMPVRDAWTKEVIGDLANHPAAEARRIAA